MADLPFADRAEAGRLLGEELSRHKLGESPVVLALTRGGVPVGFEVADRLELPLDIIVARKIGVPWQPELAMGAMAGSIQVMEHRLIQQLGISEAEVEEIVERERTEMKRREELYRGGRPAIDLEGRTAIIVDDGLATGNTMLASVRYARTMKPARVIVAVPVGSREACARLRKEADEIVCLETPALFFAVGEWYRNFLQTEDAEVQNLLAENRHRLRKQRATQLVSEG